MPIEYAEYKSLVEILGASETSDTTYEDLMKKEENVLSTVNHVVKHIQDKDIKSKQFIDMSVDTIVQRFFLLWPEMLKDFYASKTSSEIIHSLTKDDRIIYWGLLLIGIGLFMFFMF